MTDAEVGELWREAVQIKAEFRDFTDRYIKEFIRKLVEERNCRRIGCKLLTQHTHPFGDRSDALADFHIDSATWPKEWS